MLYKNNKEIVTLYRTGKKIQTIYKGIRLIFQGIDVRSCFGEGFWINEKPWINNEIWKNK